MVYDNNGKVLLFEGYLRDISEQKRVEEALSQSEILNETIVASVNDGVVVINRDLKIVTWNKYMEEISGQTQNEVLGFPLLEVFPKDMGVVIEAALQKTLDGRTISIPDTNFRFPISGSQVWLETTFAPLRTPEKRLVGVVANLHDITQRKENETEREKLLSAEQKRSRELAALTTAATTISSNLEIQQVLEVVAEQMTNLLIVDNCVIFSSDSAQNTILKEVEHHAVKGDFSSPYLPENISDQPVEISQVLKTAQPGQWQISSRAISPEFKETLEQDGVHSLLIIPLTHQERTIGLIKLEDFSNHRFFDEQEVFLAEMLGNQAAVALENARLFNETGESLKREQQLHQASREISAQTDLEEIVETTNRLITEFSGGDFSGVLLIDPESKIPQRIVYYDAPPDAPKDLPGNEGGLMYDMVKNRKPIVLDNYSVHPNALQFWKEYGIRGTLFVPLQTSESLVGFIAIFSTNPDKRFTPRDQEQATSIGRQAGVAIHKAMLYEQTRHRSDELSALYDIALATGSVLDSNTLLLRLQSNIEQLLNPDFIVFSYTTKKPNPLKLPMHMLKTTQSMRWQVKSTH